MGELIFMIILIVISIAMFFMAYDFPVSIVDKSGGAGLFPQIVAIFLVILATIQIIKILKQKKEERPKFLFFEVFKGPSLIYIVVTMVYFLIVQTLGFILSSIIYLSIIMVFFHKMQYNTLPSVKKNIIMFVCIVFGVVLIGYLFVDVFNVLLPKGILGF